MNLLLYKYRSLATEEQRTYTEDIIVNNRLYFATPSSFNDPFEYRFVMEYEENSTLTEAQRYTARHLFHHLRNSVGVLSLSAKRDDILMWSHYADSHRGVCIEFDASDATSLFGKAKPAIYQQDFPTLDISTITKVQVEQLFLTKSDQWLYEQEWRIVDRANGGACLKFEPTTLKSVILGCEISRANKDCVLEWVNKLSNSITVYQAEISRGRFALDILPMK